MTDPAPTPKKKRKLFIVDMDEKPVAPSCPVPVAPSCPPQPAAPACPEVK